MNVPRLILRCFAFFWVFILSISTLQYFNFKSDEGFLQLKQFAVKTGWYLPAFYCHIWGSSLILLAGFFNFAPWVYRNRKLHKLLGKVYVFGVLFFASPGAYVMTLFIHRGTGVFVSFLLQNTLWVTFTLSAWLLIRKRDVDTHVKMMRRSYALAFAAINLRFYIWLCHVLGHGVDFEYNYLIIAFLSWVPNLVIAELINRYDKKPVVSFISPS
ncbi:DUF2306 domain-containing protein [Mucilaginibacter mali]|uniref:DUF2306 domain-containing protein n=1 Tax=Mucilaginibacter mali TaxID=2740462 RepID=A0A7D4TZJ3_9SPHI|nr:DUF2306 domain-containing protein [Mucilaginibacter mali]QKJ32277.1 DUF2306 domain-containing protein [Mucilaginibacter mali]